MGISDREFDAIRDGGKAEVVVINGETFSSKPLHHVRLHEPTADHIEVASLTGLLDYIDCHFSTEDQIKGLVLHVESHSSVALISQPFGYYFDRHVFCRAKYKAPDRTIIDNYVDSERFAVELMATFVNDGAHADVLATVANLRDLQEEEYKDDGLSQSAVIQASVASKGVVVIKNPVFLSPMRTFTEVEQPCSPFILRLRKDPGGIKAALFLGDGGNWKRLAVQSIKEELQASMAERGMPSIAVIA